MAAEAKFIISAQDKTAGAMQSAKKNFDSGGKSVDALSAKFTQLASITALVVLAKKVGEFAISCTKDFATAERAQLRLQAALGDGRAYDKANNLVDQLGRSYNGSKDDIEGVVSALAALGKNTDQIEAITKASVNLANTTGQDLNSSYLLLSDTFEGKVSAKLKKLIPELGDLSEEQLKAGGATDLINQKLQAMTDIISGGAAQRITNLSEAFGDLKENIGQDAFNMFSPMIQWLQDLIDRTNEAIAANRLHQRVIKEGASASIENQIQDKQNQIGSQVSTQKATLAGSGLNSFSNWLKTMRASSPESYSKFDSASMQKYNLEFSKQVSEVTNRFSPVIQALQDEINSLGKQLEKNLKELDSGSKPLGAGSGAGKENAGVLGPLDIADAIRVKQFKLGLLSLDNVPQGINTAPGAENTGLGSFNPFDGMGKFGEAITKIVGGLDSFIGGVGSAIGALSSVKMILDPFGVILMGIMDVLTPVIDTLLTPLIGILRVFGQLLGMFVAPLLNMLLPVILLITKGFIALYNYALVPVQNFFIDLIEMIGNAFINIINGVIKAINKIPGVDINKVKKLDMDSQKASKISMDTIMNAGGSAITTANTAATGTGASYTGKQTINFYYYQQAPIYGSGGIKELAANLKEVYDANLNLGLA